jgi:hypothetical protein
MELAAGGGRFAGVLLLCALLGHGSTAGVKSPADKEQALRLFLRGWADKRGWSDRLDAEGRASTRYVHAWVDLRHDGEEQAIVYIEGRNWCGSGGCIMLVLQPANASFRIVGSTTITRPPIRVLERVTRGWHDIGVWVTGGGIIPGYEAALLRDRLGRVRQPEHFPETGGAAAAR